MNPPSVARARGILRPSPIVALVAFVKLAILLSCASAYGYSRDELYLLACARRLAWGYVDRPPLSIAALAVASRIYGETLLSIRVVPALAGAMVVILTARLARRFGAGTLGQGLAALSVLVAPELLAVDHVYSMESLSVLFWVAAAGLVARAITSDRAAPLPWFRVGIMLGLGALNQLTMLAFAAALFVGLAATPRRVWLRRSGPWLALAAMCAVLAPYVTWERAHGWPTRELLARHDLPGTTVLGFVREQIVMMLPTNVVVWGTGLVALLRSNRLSGYRLFGVAYLALFVAFCALASTGIIHPSDLAPAYPILIAAGASAIDERLTAEQSRRWTYPLLGVALALPGAMAAPLVLPLLRVSRYQAYARAFGIEPTTPASPLPARFAEMYGWPELARATAGVTEALPPADREDAVVLASNYGEAGALELFGGLVGLPAVISGHDDYWLWGTAGASGRVVIAVGGDEALLRASFRSVETATVFGHSLALPSEQHVRVYVCRDSLEPLDALWPRFKVYD